jgi:hypothetical protein
LYENQTNNAEMTSNAEMLHNFDVESPTVRPARRRDGKAPSLRLTIGPSSRTWSRALLVLDHTAGESRPCQCLLPGLSARCPEGAHGPSLLTNLKISVAVTPSQARLSSGQAQARLAARAGPSDSPGPSRSLPAAGARTQAQSRTRKAAWQSCHGLRLLPPRGRAACDNLKPCRRRGPAVRRSG